MYGEYVLGWMKGQLTAYVYLARPDAFEVEFLSDWGRGYLENLSKDFGVKPQWNVLDDDVPPGFVSWQSAKALVLTTSMFEFTSPVHQIEDGNPIPVYLLPLSDNDKEAIYFWMNNYHCHDNIWIGSADLETAAYKQLAETESSLSKSGRSLCATIEQATGIPTYYYLYRYFGRRATENARLCPSCGGNWQVPDKLETDKFWEFPFKCDSCRLVYSKRAKFGLLI